MRAMASITIKDIPPVLLERLRARAARDKRSMNKEAVHLLERALFSAGGIAEGESNELLGRIEAQVEAWHRLAGRWDSDTQATREIEEIYAARSRGRSVEL
jgi:plasmid stability protein